MSIVYKRLLCLFSFCMLVHSSPIYAMIGSWEDYAMNGSWEDRISQLEESIGQLVSQLAPQVKTDDKRLDDSSQSFSMHHQKAREVVARNLERKKLQLDFARSISILEGSIHDLEAQIKNYDFLLNDLTFDRTVSEKHLINLRADTVAALEKQKLRYAQKVLQYYFACRAPLYKLVKKAQNWKTFEPVFQDGWIQWYQEGKFLLSDFDEGNKRPIDVISAWSDTPKEILEGIRSSIPDEMKVSSVVDEKTRMMFFKSDPHERFFKPHSSEGLSSNQSL